MTKIKPQPGFKNGKNGAAIIGAPERIPVNTHLLIETDDDMSHRTHCKTFLPSEWLVLIDLRSQQLLAKAENNLKHCFYS